MRIYLLFIVLMCQYHVSAQNLEPIETDRPDQTETPALVPKGMFQVETGFAFEKKDQTTDNFTAATLLKYGINENFELRLITEFASSKAPGFDVSGITPILVGFKAKLADEKGVIPKTSFIAHLLLPNLASKNFKANYYATEFRFTMAHSLTDKLSLSYNLGAEWDGFSPEPTFLYTLATGFSLTEKMGAYAEIYGFAPQHDIAEHSFDGGLTYLISNNFMIDISGGFAISENAPDFFAAFGFSFRL